MLLAAGETLDPAGEAEAIALRDGSLRSADFRSGVEAFAAKRAPRWHGR